MASTLKSICFIVKDGSKGLLLLLRPFQPLSSRGCVESSREELVAEEPVRPWRGELGKEWCCDGQRASGPFRDQWPLLAIFSVVKVPRLPEARVGKSDRSMENSTLQADGGRWASQCWQQGARSVSACVLISVSFFWIAVKYMSHIHCLACMRAQLCPTLCDPMDCSLPGSSVHGTILSGILEWAAISSSRGSSRPRDGARASCASCTGGWILSLSYLGSPGSLS